jgi:ubiquitin-activating enzyme E1
MIDFEKDDDTNHHVEFVTAASNLRAENYDIPQADSMKTKQIAGRIIPALATTTAVVAGLVSIELYKIVEAGGKIAKAPLERFKNGFLNLAGPFYTFSEPGKAPIKKYGEHEFTLWDCLEIRGPMTMKGVIDWITDNTGLQVSMLTSGASLLYAFFQPPAKIKERMDKE